jgi:hypothetical protein
MGNRTTQMCKMEAELLDTGHVSPRLSLALIRVRATGLTAQ